AVGAAHRRRFRILAVVWVSYLLVYLARLSVGPLSPFLKDAFDLSNAQVGALMSATAFTYAPTLIVAGWLVDRAGVRRMLAAGTLIASLCVLTLFLASSYWVVLGLLALSGIGAGCIYPSAVRAVLLWFPVGERATAIGVNQTAINISGIFGAVTLPVIAVRLGWEYGFLAVGALGLAVFAVAVVGYGDPPGEDGDRSAAATGALAGPPMRPGAPASVTGGTSALWLAPAPPPAGLLTLLAARDVRLLALVGLFLGVVEYSALAHLVLYLKSEFLLTAVAAGAVLALAEASGAIGKPVSGLFSDRRLGGRRRPALLAMAALALVACLALAAFGADLGAAVYVVVALLGLSAIGWGGLFGTAAGEIGGRAAAGQVAGLTAAAVNVGVFVGPPGFGALVDLTGSYALAWLTLAVSCVAAMGCIWLLDEPRELCPVPEVCEIPFDEL
ncbi:MAG: MFS transporter, partial [Thermoleophilia bacterium]|nr:MFS transporter [Thermoleophilia bacterium]